MRCQPEDGCTRGAEIESKMGPQAKTFGKHWYRPLPLQRTPRSGITSSRSVGTAHHVNW